MPSRCKIAVVLPVFNRRLTTLRCIETLSGFNSDQYRLTILVIDDGSSDGTARAIKDAHPDIIIIEGDGNLWWAGGVNRGFTYIKHNIDCDLILIMNDDSIFDQTTLDRLFRYVISSPNACVSALAIVASTGGIFCGGHKQMGFLKRCIPLYQNKQITKDLPAIIECDSLSSRFVLVPRGILETVGYFNEKRFPQGYSDIDFFLRAKAAGYKNVVLSDSIVATEPNSDYITHRFADMSTITYLRSFFSNKHGNSISLLFYSAIVHKNPFIGFLDLTYRMLSVGRFILRKIIHSCSRV